MIVPRQSKGQTFISYTDATDKLVLE